MVKVINKYSSIIKNINRHVERISLLKEKELKQSTIENINRRFFEMDREYASDLRTLLEVKDVKGKEYIRVGKEADGGYVLVDSFGLLDGVFSIGIGTEVGFDQFFANKGIDVYMYDHTIDGLPVLCDRFHWEKIGVCGKNNRSKNMKTLTEIVEGFGNKKLLLKMDIEGYEWDVLSDIEIGRTLDAFDQIVLELHGMLEYSLKEKIKQSLRNINETHQLVHVHANNQGSALAFDDWILPDLLEATYVNKKNYQFVKNSRLFPTDKDRKNKSLFPEIQLGSFS